MVRVATITVRLDGKDAHRWDGFGNLARPFECEAIFFGDAFVDIVFDEILFFFIVAFQLDLNWTWRLGLAGYRALVSEYGQGPKIFFAETKLSASTELGVADLRKELMV